MIDPVLGGIVVAGITSATSVAGTLLVQRHTAKNAQAETVEESENARITDLKASHELEMGNLRSYYTQLLTDRDTRYAELRADFQSVKDDLRLHNDALLQSAAAHERMVKVMSDLFGETTPNPNGRT